MRKAHDTFLTSIDREKDARQREAERRAEQERQRRNEVWQELLPYLLVWCAYKGW